MHMRLLVAYLSVDFSLVGLIVLLKLRLRLKRTDCMCSSAAIKVFKIIGLHSNKSLQYQILIMPYHTMHVHVMLKCMIFMRPIFSNTFLHNHANDAYSTVLSAWFRLR